MVTPTTGLSAANAIPRAAERPTRSPVKLPGPVVAAMRSSAENGSPDCFMTRAISGIRASAWPRLIGLRFLRDQLAGVGVEHAGGAGVERGIDGEDQHGASFIIVTRPRTGGEIPLRQIRSSDFWHSTLDAVQMHRTTIEVH